MSKILTPFSALIFLVVLCTIFIIGQSSSTKVDAAWCNEKSNATGPMNNNPVDYSAPVFVKRVPGAELYTVGENIDDQISLVHLYGKSGYDWGFSYGTLMGTPALENMNSFWTYMTDQIISVVNNTNNQDHLHIPQWFIDAVAQYGIEIALDMQNDFAKPYMLPSWYDEMRGMADAIEPNNATKAGELYTRIVQIHMIAELTKGRCSFYGLTGEMTKGGSTLQLRALDWDMGTGIQNNPQIVIYHPESPELGHPFANIGWAGVVMTLSGVGAARVGISEIGISYPDSTFGDEVPWGIPFTFLERYLIQFAKNIDDGIQIIQNANRTCRLILGMADGNMAKSTLVQYSHSIVNFYDGINLEPNTWYHHPISPDATFLAMDWACPYYNNLMMQQLVALKGTITPEISIQNITAPVMTGSLHCNVYDLSEMSIYTANARGAQDDPNSPKDAYQRQFVKVQLLPAFNKPYGQN